MRPSPENDLIAAHWDEMRTDAHRRWPDLSDNELSIIDGHKDMLVGVLQEHYWVSREEAARQASEFEREWALHAA
jgi:uncharacterized protein YjbJ (UPF0337 family)